MTDIREQIGMSRVKANHLDKTRETGAANLLRMNADTMERLLAEQSDFPNGFVLEILTLLDRIEITDDPSLAGQRFDIAEKHELTVEFREKTSSYDN